MNHGEERDTSSYGYHSKDNLELNTLLVQPESLFQLDTPSKEPGDCTTPERF